MINTTNEALLELKIPVNVFLRYDLVNQASINLINPIQLRFQETVKRH